MGRLHTASLESRAFALRGARLSDQPHSFHVKVQKRSFTRVSTLLGEQNYYSASVPTCGGGGTYRTQCIQYVDSMQKTSGSLHQILVMTSDKKCQKNITLIKDLAMMLLVSRLYLVCLVRFIFGPLALLSVNHYSRTNSSLIRSSHCVTTLTPSCRTRRFPNLYCTMPLLSMEHRIP